VHPLILERERRSEILFFLRDAKWCDLVLIKLYVCVLLTMPVASATAEMSFSVLRHLKTYVRSTMKNDRKIKHNFNDFDRQEFLKIVQNLPFVS
jgi:hypothetical protein